VAHFSDQSAGGSRRGARGASSLVRKARDPNSGVVGQGVRYAMAGGVVASVYLGVTVLLAGVVGVHFQVALAIGFCCGITVHFTLQRFFVWAQEDEFALPFRHQASRYLLVAGTQYGVTAASTSLLPKALGLPTELVYGVTVLAVVSLNFLIFRHGVFHAKTTATGA
jgi:putative flippase GtrA